MTRVSNRGFSLIELLMVVAIIAIVTAITIPQLVASTRGNRLRAATRLVIMSGRYARSMAVLKQEDMAVVYNLSSGTISIRPAAQRAAIPTDEELELTAEDLGGDEAVFFDGEVDSSEAKVSGAAEISRKLDRVTIDYVEKAEEERAAVEGTSTILYSNNGRCTPHVIRLRDQFGQGVTIEVDALSTVTTGEE